MPSNMLDDIRVSGIVTIRDRLLKLDNPLRLESGEPSFDTAEHIKEAAKAALDRNETHYVNSQGIIPLREALLEKLEKENKIEACIDDILVSNGGMHGLYSIFSSIIESGDDVLIPSPNWTCVQWLIQMTGANAIHVPLHEEKEFRFDFEELESKITEKTKAILINSPHNPTGAVFLKEDYEKLIEIMHRHNIYVISDEAYEHIIYDDHKHLSFAQFSQEFPEIRDRVFSVFTFSKSYAMTGWRLGYVLSTNVKLMKRMKKVVLYTANGVNSITQWAGVGAIKGEQNHVKAMRDSFNENRKILTTAINESKYLYQSFMPKGAFYAFPKISNEWQGINGDQSDVAFANMLIDNGKLGCVPGSVFGPNGVGYLRFSYACSKEMVEAAVRVLTEFA